MIKKAAQLGRRQLMQAIVTSRSALAPGPFRDLLRAYVPGQRELRSIAPIKRGFLLGLAGLLLLALAAPIVAIASLEFAIASQSAAGGAGARTSLERENQGVGTHDNILQHPLFSRSRQAPAIAAAPAIFGASPPPDRMMLDSSVALRGVFMNGERAKAFMTSSDNPVGAWVALNEQWSGWRLSEIKPNEIVLEADGERQTLHLSVLAK